MTQFSKIAWTDHTFNPWIGCAKVSDGCAHCYAEVDTFARRSRAAGLELWGPRAARHVTSLANWAKPLAWDRAARAAGVRHRVFCASLADVFEDRPELADERARLFALIRETQDLDWLLLTKRPENIVRLWAAARADVEAAQPEGLVPKTLPNLWLGTTAENQATAETRVPELLRAPAVVRFVSAEPLLGPLILDPWMPVTIGPGKPAVDWVIVGGESGPRARPFDMTWARWLRSQCVNAGAAFFMKQAGARPYLPGFASSLRDPKGGDPEEWPADLRVREWPVVVR